jgi:hypothetical protein
MAPSPSTFASRSWRFDLESIADLPAYSLATAF